MKRRLTKLAVLFLLGAIVAFPLGIALDALFPVPVPTTYKTHYRGSISLWLIGEGADQQISDEPEIVPLGTCFSRIEAYPWI